MFQGDEAFRVLGRVVVEEGLSIFREGNGGILAYAVQSSSVEILWEIEGEQVVYATID